MLVGFTDNHFRDVFCKLNLEIYRVLTSRDVVWLNKKYKDWIIEKSTICKEVEHEDDDLPLNKNPNTVMINETPSYQVKQKSAVNKMVYSQLRKLDSWFNPQSRNAVEDFKKREITLEQSNFSFFSEEVLKDPMNFDETWNFIEKVHQSK
jgi:hypothetical protein